MSSTSELSFTVMTFFGIWRPRSLVSKWSIVFYKIYNIFIITFLMYFALSMFINLCLHFDDFELIAENTSYLCGQFIVCFKIIYISVYRKDIIILRDMFLEKSCIPRNDREQAIKLKVYESNRFNSKIFMGCCFINVISVVIGPLMKGKNVYLPFKNWMPYEINSRQVFWITYIYQSIFCCLLSALFPAVEIFAAVMMQQVCVQLDLCMCRLIELPHLLKQHGTEIDIYRQETELIKNCVQHHIYIYRIEKKLNEVFSLIIFIQFFAWTMCFGTLVYQLSKISITSLKFWSVATVLNSYFIHIFLYCWFGDKMIEKSMAISNVIYQMNRTSLTKRTKKNLIMIMLRSNKPITLEGASMIPMTIDTFVKILKASFSAFNLLQSTTK